jgi:hypothetical protein
VPLTGLSLGDAVLWVTDGARRRSLLGEPGGCRHLPDAATGQAHYEQRLPESVWATPLGVGDRVYLFGKNGTTTITAAGPAWRVLATNRLSDPVEV